MYDIILADPPWRYKNWSMAEQAKYDEKWARRNGRSPYPVMTTDEIATLPVNKLGAKDSLLAMWVTDPKLAEGLEVMSAWGYTYKTVLFTWIKTNPKGLKIRLRDAYNLTMLNMTKDPDEWLRLENNMIDGFHFGLGFHTRANPEMCLLGSKGKGVSRVDNSVAQLIVAPVGEHSSKPTIVRTRIEQLYGEQKRVELFARDNNINGWDCWGNEVESTPDIIEIMEKT